MTKIRDLNINLPQLYVLDETHVLLLPLLNKNTSTGTQRFKKFYVNLCGGERLILTEDEEKIIFYREGKVIQKSMT